MMCSACFIWEDDYGCCVKRLGSEAQFMTFKLYLFINRNHTPFFSHILLKQPITQVKLLCISKNIYKEL